MREKIIVCILFIVMTAIAVIATVTFFSSLQPKETSSLSPATKEAGFLSAEIIELSFLPFETKVSAQKSGYLGCFKDTSDFDLNGYLERSRSNTPQRCVGSCLEKGFRFAGIQYSESCLCGNSYGKYGTATNCNMKCTGDNGQICGGINANSIYTTGAGAGGGSGWEPINNQSTLNGTNLTYYRGTTAQQCQAECDKNPNCKGFTFIRAGAYNARDAAVCYLLSEVTGAAASSCCISGVKKRGSSGGGGCQAGNITA